MNNSLVSNTQTSVQNRVLKNTYMLLALSMLPTIAGAWFGISSGIMNSFGGMLSLIIFFAGAFGFIFLIERNKNSPVGVALLLGFTFFMGVMLSRLLGHVLGFSNGAELIMLAFGGTATIFGGMAFLSTVIKKDLSSMGKFLFIGLIMLIIASIANVFIGSATLMIVLSVIAIGIFSAFLLYDLQRIVNGGETNYISATLSIYLSLFNIFQSLLSLLGIFDGED